MGSLQWVGGSLSGVGKSVITRAIADYCEERGCSIVLFDADPYKSDVAPFCQEVIRDTTKSGFLPLDEWVEAAVKGDKTTVLVNLPERAEVTLGEWIEANVVDEVVSEHNLAARYWWVSDGSAESLEFLKAQLDKWGEWMPHVLVKNAYFCNYWSNGGEVRWQHTWEQIENQPWYQTAYKQNKICSVEFPKLYWAEMKRLDKSPMSFSKSICHSEFFAMTRSRIFRFVEDFSSAFDKVFANAAGEAWR